MGLTIGGVQDHCVRPDYATATHNKPYFSYIAASCFRGVGNNNIIMEMEGLEPSTIWVDQYPTL